jgi:hypothetical protein
VSRGGFAFYSAEDLLGSGEPITCTVKNVLHIPQGEVHRVKITDPAGVTYKMWTPIPSTSCFQQMLAPALKELVRRNLELPEVENRYDDAQRAHSPLASADQQFLEDFVSPCLAMHTKAGVILDKHSYLRRDAAPFRRLSGGPVEILHVTSQP